MWVCITLLCWREYIQLPPVYDISLYLWGTSESDGEGHIMSQSLHAAVLSYKYRFAHLTVFPAYAASMSFVSPAVGLQRGLATGATPPL